MSRVITSRERETIDGHKLRGWLTSKDYRKKEELYFALLDTVGPLLADRAGNPDPRLLSELLAITIEGDSTFRGWMRKRRNSARLRSAQGWQEAATCAAVLVVERYEHKRGERPAPEATTATTDEETAA